MITQSFIIPNSSTSSYSPPILLQLSSKRNDLIQKRRTLPRRILRNLIPQMIHLRSRRTRRLSLRRLNPTNLHLQKELWDFNRQIAGITPNPRLGGQVDVQTILEALEIGICEWSGGGEFLEGEGQG